MKLSKPFYQANRLLGYREYTQYQKGEDRKDDDRGQKNYCHQGAKIRHVFATQNLHIIFSIAW